MALEAVLLKRAEASALGRGPTLTIPGELSEPREPSREPNCWKPEIWVSEEVRAGGWRLGRARVEGSPGGTGKAVARWVHNSGQGGEAVGAAAGAPREEAAAQPVEGTGGSPPQLHPHPLEVEEAPEQQGWSQWGCPVKAAPQQNQVSWAPSQIWGGK
jgi:hypothetical protein